MALTTDNDKSPKLVKIEQSCFIEGKLAEVGDVVKVDAHTYKVLVGAGRASLAPDGSKPGKAEKPEAEKPKDEKPKAK